MIETGICVGLAYRDICEIELEIAHARDVVPLICGRAHIRFVGSPPLAEIQCCHDGER